MRKSSLYLMLGLMIIGYYLVGSQTRPVWAIEEPQLKTGVVTGEPGAQIQIPIALQSRGEVAAIQFKLTYDPNLLVYLTESSSATPTSGELNPGFHVLASPVDQQSLTVMVLSLNNETIVSGTGTIVWLPFRILESAQRGQSCALELKQVILSDALGQPIIHQAWDGQLKVDGYPVERNKPYWTVRFNQAIDPDSVNAQNVRIREMNGYSQKLTFALNPDGHSMTVGLAAGSTYTPLGVYGLELSTALRSSTGVYLKNPVVRWFSVN